MCLTVKSDKSYSVAEEDIVCYKVLILSDGKLSSPYMRMPYEVGITAGACLPLVAIDASKETYIIEEGLHTFISKKDVDMFLANVCLSPFSANLNIAVCEAIIPMGSVYYEGIFESLTGADENVVLGSYASNRLVVEKILYEHEITRRVRVG